MNEPKPLQLIMKRIYFDQILTGEKTEEVREVRPTTIKKYMHDKGSEGLFIREYSSLILFAGYEKDRPSLEVEVKDIIVEFLDDEDGNPITYLHEGTEWDAVNIVYVLGKVLNTKNC